MLKPFFGIRNISKQLAVIRRIAHLSSAFAAFRSGRQILKGRAWGSFAHWPSLTTIDHHWHSSSLHSEISEPIWMQQSAQPASVPGTFLELQTSIMRSCGTILIAHRPTYQTAKLKSFELGIGYIILESINVNVSEKEYLICHDKTVWFRYILYYIYYITIYIYLVIYYI